jgi:hypothetical protein
MGRKTSLATFLAAVLVPAAAAGPAEAARTLGSTVVPGGSAPSACGTGQVIAQVSSDPATPFAVPPGGGQITQWQTNTSGDPPGAAVTLVVVRSGGGGDQAVVATDGETLPNPLPAGGVASFSLSAPIAVTGGETLGLYTDSNAGATCYWSGGTTSSQGALMALAAPNPPAAGQTLTPSRANSPGGFELNVAATLFSNDDAGVIAAAGPANATVGDLAQLAASVTDGGPNSGPISFTDNVPSGLMIDSVVAGSGSCSTAGQEVSCTITGLAAHQSAPVDITVTPVAAGSYVNRASVAPASGVDDPVVGNDSASASLTVAPAPTGGGPPAPPPCLVPPLLRTPLAIVERVLPLLNCRIGNVNHVHAKTIAKGLVIKSGPGAGAYANGLRVALDVSAGPRKPRRRPTARSKPRHTPAQLKS